MSSNIVLISSDSGFMDTYLMKDSIDRVTLPYIRFVNLDGKEDYHHTLLVLEDFSAHKVLEVKEYCLQYNILIYFGGYTWCSQCLDVTLNRPTVQSRFA